MENSNLFLCLLGISAICSLICLILLVHLIRLQGSRHQDTPVSAAEPVPTTASASSGSVAAEPIPQELVAAVSAALAESLGTDISRIRIHSFKKL